jgi:hypothetical protein
MTFAINSNQRDPVRVRLNHGETVRWEDDRPFQTREGSWLTVIMSPDGTSHMRGMIFYYPHMTTEAWPGKRQSSIDEPLATLQSAACGMMGP